MTSRVGPKGQVVIPKHLRDRLGILPGDDVDVSLDGDHVAVHRHDGLRPLRGRFRGSDLTARLFAERHADRRQEDGR